jgi:plasmid maintenance system antidote protein VapI
MTMAKKEFTPVMLGEMLKEEFLAEYGLSQNQLGKAIGISPSGIAEIDELLPWQLCGLRRQAA